MADVAYIRSLLTEHPDFPKKVSSPGFADPSQCRESGLMDPLLCIFSCVGAGVLDDIGDCVSGHLPHYAKSGGL